MPCNWQQEDWPTFRYDLSGAEDALFAVAERTGPANRLLKGQTADAQTDATVGMMVIEAMKTSGIEGELLNHRDVMSSIRKDLATETSAPGGDERAQGAAASMIEVRNNFEFPGRGTS